jgi:hypothetical protein
VHFYESNGFRAEFNSNATNSTVLPHYMENDKLEKNKYNNMLNKGLAVIKAVSRKAAIQNSIINKKSIELSKLSKELVLYENPSM